MKVHHSRPPGPKISLRDAYLQASGRRDPLEFLSRMAREYGDVVHFRIGRYSIYQLNHPELVRDVLVTRYQNFSKGRGIDRRNNFLGEGLITSEGDFHRRQRKLINPAFHRERIADYCDVMVACAGGLGDRWQPGQEIEVADEMKRLTLAIVSKAFFSRDSQPDAATIVANVALAIDGFKPFRFPLSDWLQNMLVPANRRFERARKQLEQFIARLIENRRRTGTDHGDLISLLLMAQAEDANGLMTDVQVRDEALTIFLAGYETSAQALTWTWYLLSQHPEIETKLLEEVDTVLGKRTPTIHDFPRLQLTLRVFKEAVRLYPPAWRLMRCPINDYCVRDYMIPARSLVLLSPYVMHRDPRFYPQPTLFDPDRWLHVAESNSDLRYFPFGAGPRRCLGEGFTWMEAVLSLAVLAQRWRLRLVPGHPVEALPMILLRPKYGMRMVAEPR